MLYRYMIHVEFVSKAIQLSECKTNGKVLKNFFHCNSPVKQRALRFLEDYTFLICAENSD